MAKTISDISFSATDTTKTETIFERGFGELILIDVPNFTNAVTATLAILDDEGYTLWSKSGIAKNSVSKYGGAPDAADTGDFPLVQNGKISITLSGAPGSAGVVKVRTYFKPERAR